MGAEPVFRGVGVALVTLFDDDFRVAAEATAQHAGRCIDSGVSAVVVAGSTGEAATLTPDERSTLLTAVRKAVDGRVPVIAGTGTTWTGAAVELTQRACDDGADAVLALSPPGGRGDPRGYYADVVKAANGVPVLAYHYPAVSSPGIVVGMLPELDGVVGLKDSSGDPERLLETLRIFEHPVYTGSSAILSFAGPVGVAGAILALANIEPEGCIAALTGDGDAQRALWPTHSAYRGIASLKEGLAHKFGTSPVSRVV
jgi:4-hydroxy-tetrahydrodipicolinate synthase